MGTPAYNYSAAFVQYCAGMPTEEIAQVFCIPEESLRNKMSVERWNQLRNQVDAQALAVAASEQKAGQLTGCGYGGTAEAKARVLMENRERNYELWCKLRDEAAGVIGDLCAGTLKFKRYFHNKGQVVEHICDPTMSDRTALANYLQMIALGTYSALGDRGAANGSREGDTVGPASQAPAITIVLPGAISMPRAERGLADLPGVQVVEGQKVVDI